MIIKVVRGKHNRMEEGSLETYEAGEFFDGTKGELLAFAGKLARAEDPKVVTEERRSQPEGEPEQDKKPKGKGKGGKGGAK